MTAPRRFDPPRPDASDGAGAGRGDPSALTADLASLDLDRVVARFRRLGADPVDPAAHPLHLPVPVGEVSLPGPPGEVPPGRDGADPFGGHVATPEVGVWPWLAATALVVAPGDDGLATILIERAERIGDRWSGHIALPGGRNDPDDRDLAETAIREAAEEVGVELPPPVGRLPDQVRSSLDGIIGTFVFTLPEQCGLVPAPAEAVSADWVPLTHLYDPRNATVHVKPDGTVHPGIRLRDRAIWGMTRRILDDFGRILGLPPLAD